MLKIFSTTLLLSTVKSATRRLAIQKPIFSGFLTAKKPIIIAPVQIQQRQYARSRQATSQYNFRNLFSIWGRAPFIRIPATPSKFPMSRLWSWGAVLSVGLFIPLVNIPVNLLLNGFAINAYRDRLLSSTYIQDNFGRMPAYKSEPPVKLLKDGLWALITPLLFGIIVATPTALFAGAHPSLYLALAAPPVICAALLAYFAPLMAAYALVNEDKRSKWASVLQIGKIRRIWRTLRPRTRADYKQAAISSFLCFGMSFLVSAFSMGILSGPALLWGYLTVAEMFGDLLNKEQDTLRLE